MQANGWHGSAVIAIALCFAGTASFSQCQPAGATELTQSQIDALSACIKASETENAQLKEQIRKLESRLSALSVIVQDLVDDDGLAKTNNRINTIETRLGKPNVLTEQVNANVVPAVGGDLDTRAVVAFTSEKGERTCPPGWKPFEEAKDRFILGAGNKYQEVGSTGGEETVKLEERHMPSHSHSVESSSSAAFSLSGVDDKKSTNPHYVNPANNRGHPNQIMKAQPEGGNKAHNNMPPWIALYYCIKE